MGKDYRWKGAYELERDTQGLTKREREVLDKIRAGAVSQAQIARELDMTRQRVSEIVKNLSDKGWVRVEGRKLFVVPAQEGTE